MNARATAIWMIAPAILLAIAAFVHWSLPEPDGAALEVARIETGLAALLVAGAFAPVLGRCAPPLVLALQILALIALSLGLYLSLVGIGPRTPADAALRLITIAVVSFGVLQLHRGTAARD